MSIGSFPMVFRRTCGSYVSKVPLIDDISGGLRCCQLFVFVVSIVTLCNTVAVCDCTMDRDLPEQNMLKLWYNSEASHFSRALPFGNGRQGAMVLGGVKGDRVIWIVVVLLAVISLLAVYSSSQSLAYSSANSTIFYLFKQMGRIFF